MVDTGTSNVKLQENTIQDKLLKAYTHLVELVDDNEVIAKKLNGFILTKSKIITDTSSIKSLAIGIGIKSAELQKLTNNLNILIDGRTEGKPKQ